MADNIIYLENPKTGQLREAPVGFSWTTLFFGPIPMLFRSHWKWAAIFTILAIITMGLSNIVFAFLINKLCIKDLIGDGFKAKSVRVGTLDQVSLALGFSIPALESAA
ncbi:MAG: hypothetical protein OHM77_10160 [Candidatus Nitricoxidivorans perseverans]|uniref:DUF2628 domain-containing protein n=1 Tax=Candidatus Nitricoxidivorans perseverans TaxID=2975601 RepID=A0AA49IY41_9PROT|nr:MAG: hypothetical protein OHM77_10160 [Candidatus Nitricoxidivorans perseverans]